VNAGDLVDKARAVTGLAAAYFVGRRSIPCRRRRLARYIPTRAVWRSKNGCSVATLFQPLVKFHRASANIRVSGACHLQRTALLENARTKMRSS
jgi:hypothetical protein